MTLIQLQNLIIYFIILYDDYAIYDDKYIIKNIYDKIFTGNIKKYDYENSDEILRRKINDYNHKFSYSINDVDFSIIYVSHYLTYKCYYGNGGITGNDEYYVYVLNYIIKTYKQFFFFNSIINEDMSYLLKSEYSRQQLKEYILYNNRIFKLLQLKEKIYK